jgi:PAS domain-containing protein
MAETTANLSAADRNLLAILDSLYMGIMIIDPEDHLIVYANSEAAALMRRRQEEIVGRRCHDRVCPAEVGKCPITDLGQEIDHSERCVLDADREEVPIIKTVKWIRFKGRRHLLESFLGIAAIKEKERLEGVLEMAGAATHHLSQPTQVLLSGANYLKKNDFDPKVTEIATAMLTAVKRLTDRITRIQAITHYKSETYVNGYRIVDVLGASEEK